MKAKVSDELPSSRNSWPDLFDSDHSSDGFQGRGDSNQRVVGLLGEGVAKIGQARMETGEVLHNSEGWMSVSEMDGGGGRQCEMTRRLRASERYRLVSFPDLIVLYSITYTLLRNLRWKRFCFQVVVFGPDRFVLGRSSGHDGTSTPRVRSFDWAYFWQGLSSEADDGPGLTDPRNHLVSMTTNRRFRARPRKGNVGVVDTMSTYYHML